MKRVRKGFTLAELLIVIAIIGVLASMMMVSGSGAASTARAMKIVEGFESISAAMMTYYTNNADACDTGTKTANDIKNGIVGFLKDGGANVVADKAAEGKYYFSIDKADKSWWLTYTFAAADTEVGTILKDKAAALSLKASAAATVTSGTGENATTTNNPYEGGKTVCVKVR